MTPDRLQLARRWARARNRLALAAAFLTAGSAALTVALTEGEFTTADRDPTAGPSSRSVLRVLAVEPGPGRLARGSGAEAAIDLGTQRRARRFGKVLRIRNIDRWPYRVRVSLVGSLLPIRSVALRPWRAARGAGKSRHGRARRPGRADSRRIVPGSGLRLELRTSERAPGAFRGALAISVNDSLYRPLVIPLRVTQAPAPPRRSRGAGVRDRAHLIWSPSESSRVSGYLIERWGSRGYRRRNRRPVQQLNFVDRRVSPGVRYRYRVRAVTGRRDRIAGRPGAVVRVRIPPQPTSIRVGNRRPGGPGVIGAAARRRVAVVVGLPSTAAVGDLLRISISDGRRTVRGRSRLRANVVRRHRAALAGLDVRRLAPGRLRLVSWLERGRSIGPALAGRARLDPTPPARPSAVSIPAAAGRWPEGTINSENRAAVPVMVTVTGPPPARVQVRLRSRGHSVSRQVRWGSGPGTRLVRVSALSLPDASTVTVRARSLDSAGNRSPYLGVRARKDTRGPFVNFSRIVVLVFGGQAAVAGRPGALTPATDFTVQPGGRGRPHSGRADRQGAFLVAIGRARLPRTVRWRFSDDALNTTISLCRRYKRSGTSGSFVRC